MESLGCFWQRKAAEKKVGVMLRMLISLYKVGNGQKNGLVNIVVLQCTTVEGGLEVGLVVAIFAPHNFITI